MKEHLKNFALLTGSTLIMAVGIYFFKFANNFTFGGITGFAVLVAKFTPLSASDFSFIANMLLLIIGLFVLGKKFAAQTAYSGGTDVIAMILKKYTSVDIGKGLLASDILFTIAGFFVFDIKTGLYSLLGLTMRSTLIESLIESLNRSKYFHVVCSEPEPICEFIKNDLKRGATIVLAQGAFTGDDKYIILTVLSPNEAIKLRNFIKAHTTGAFLLISNTSEIIGKGFHSV